MRTFKRTILTGCCGFIGSQYVRDIAAKNTQQEYLIIDSLGYAGFLPNIQEQLDQHSHLSFKKIDIRNNESLQTIFESFNPDSVIHFAAESHVDRSITEPSIFIETNVNGTANLLNHSLKQFEKNPDFLFHHISTDEVYGSLKDQDPAFTEAHPIQANSPYSASKASSDLLVLAYHETYKLPIVITRCSNNYGPNQAPEKLIPLMITYALENKKLPVYGTGLNIRDWIHVQDHNEGVQAVFENGKIGQVYNLGGNSEQNNLNVVKFILKELNKPESLISFVEDRKGHDWRYAMDLTKIKNELNWSPKITFEQGLKQTIQWYVNNTQWVKDFKTKNKL